MGYCDLKQVRSGKAWYQTVNELPMSQTPRCIHGAKHHCKTYWRHADPKMIAAAIRARGEA